MARGQRKERREKREENSDQRTEPCTISGLKSEARHPEVGTKWE